jgi:hypothetical protein
VPLSAFALLGTFVGSAIAIACVVTWAVGPRRLVALVLPSIAAVGALGLVGHQARVGFGPTVNLYGYDVRLLFDLGLALVVSLAVALAQRAVLERRARRGPPSEAAVPGRRS